MKRLMILIFAAAVLASCVKDAEYRSAALPSAPEGAAVTIPFSVTVDNAAVPGTRTVVLDEEPTLDNLYIAVFGGSGYLKEYVKAQDLQAGTYTYTDREGEQRTVTQYTFNVTLTITENRRILHFIGNGPATLSFGYADAVMPSLLSEDGAKAYWQMRTVSEIGAKRSTSEYQDGNGRNVVTGDYIDKDGNKIVDGKGYVPDDAILAALSNIPLVRNWAKISIEAADDSNFTPYSFAVVNVPSRGAVAPHSAATGFVQDYQQYAFSYLTDELKYPANLPPKTIFDKSIPDAEDFVNINAEKAVAPVGGSVYLYERPVPTSKLPPSSVIVYGHYKNLTDPSEQEGDYYYKLDLMQDETYYPVLRNFQYKIKISKIMSQGHHSPAAAAAAAGSADVSADITASHLSDISNGIGRLIVDWMSHTYTVQENNGLLSCFFVNDVKNWVVDMTPGTVTATALPMPEGESPVITELSIDPPQTEAESAGWRIVHFKTDVPRSSVRSQTIRIQAQYESWHLYRDVVITLLDKQPMIARCVKTRVLAQRNVKQTLEVVIPEGLPESMFPLRFEIEPEDMTLTPDESQDNNNLPVTPGPSISDNPEYSGKPSFHFVRTLYWDEYRTLETERDQNMSTWRVLPCYFKTNCDDNATTIWVKCEHFDPVSTSFRNASELGFPNLGFTSSIERGGEKSVFVHFDVDKDPLEESFPVVTMSVSGMQLVITGDNMSAVPGSSTMYMVHPASSSVDLEFLTTDPEGDVTLRLYAQDYETQELKSHKFKNFGFVDGHRLWKTSAWSNVACGRVNSAGNKTVLFGYEDDPDGLNVPVTVKDISGLTCLTPSSYPYTPDGPRSTVGKKTYHELEFRTVAPDNNKAVGFTLSAPGYVEETIQAYRFSGNILTQDQINTNTVLKPGNTYGFDADAASPSFTIVQNTGSSNPFVSFTFDGISELRSDAPKGLLLESGQTYTLTVKTLNDQAYKLFYVQFNVNNTKWNGVSRIMAPKSGVPDIGTFEAYRGANDQFIWNIPEGHTEASITFTPHDDYPISIKEIIFKSYKGTMRNN